MRAYQVTAQPGGKVIKFAIASTQADAKAKRDDLVEELGIKKKDVTIEEIEISTSKNDLIEYINCQIEDAYSYGAKSSQDDDD